MAIIGNPIYQSAFVTDQFSGDGTTTAFTMSVAPAGVSNVLVAVSGVLQDPSTYGVVGTTINFSTAPPSGTGNISCRYLGVPVTGVTTTAYRTVTEFTATASQTTFTPPSYTVGFINVYRNGVLLGSADYTASNGTTVVLATGATAGDLVTVESFQVSSVVNAIQNTAGSVGTTNIAGGAVTTAKIASGVTINFADGSASTPSITNDGDTNTGIFFPAADTIAFAEGGVEVARFDSSGNLGIGTTTTSTTAAQPCLFLGIGNTGASYNSTMRMNGYSSTAQLRYTFNQSGSGTGWGIGSSGNDAFIIGTVNDGAIGSVAAERMRIDASGRMTVPAQPAFSVYKAGGAFTVVGGVVVFDTASLNVGSSYSTSTGRFTAPVTGNYRFVLCANLSAGYGTIYFRKNGSNIRAANTQVNANWCTVTLAVNVALNSGDYVEAYSDTTQQWDNSSYNGFSGELIG
jgi:hypothetical protein